jgi:hypothetical protein
MLELELDSMPFKRDLLFLINDPALLMISHNNIKVSRVNDFHKCILTALEREPIFQYFDTMEA